MQEGFAGWVVEVHGCGKLPGAFEEGWFLAQHGGVFFADDLVCREGVVDGGDDGGLGGEVGDCDWGLVFFVEGAFVYFGEELFCEERGSLDGQAG